MINALQEAAADAFELLAKIGRGSTPPVKDRELPIKTHVPDPNSEPQFAVAVIGGSDFLTSYDVETSSAHPNTLEQIIESPGMYQALLVNARDMRVPWQGAVTGSAAWKSQKIYEACSAFRSAGIPVYVIEPEVTTTAFLRWQSLASATFPEFTDESEQTGNPHSALWDALMRLEYEK